MSNLDAMLVHSMHLRFHLILAVGFMLATCLSTFAQNRYSTIRLPRFEMGEQTVYDRIGCVATGTCNFPSIATGPAATYNFNQNLSIDGQSYAQRTFAACGHNGKIQ